MWRRDLNLDPLSLSSPGAPTVPPLPHTGRHLLCTPARKEEKERRPVEAPLSPRDGGGRYIQSRSRRHCHHTMEEADTYKAGGWWPTSKEATVRTALGLYIYVQLVFKLCYVTSTNIQRVQLNQRIQLIWLSKILPLSLSIRRLVGYFSQPKRLIFDDRGSM